MTELLPLNKPNRILIARAFANVLRVDMSIDCVIEDQMGQAIVDDAQAPTVFRLEVGPFRYLAGEATSAGGEKLLESLQPYTILMPSAAGWADAAREKYQERLVTIGRFRYASESLTAAHLQRLIAQSNHTVKQMDLAFVQQLWPQNNFIDLSDYDSPEDFARRGIGYYAEHEGQVIGAAYASLVCSKGIEVSIFVEGEHRRRGMAMALASHLLAWCVERGVHPNWDAANPMSYGLAEKLGYKPLGRYTAYYLKA